MILNKSLCSRCSKSAIYINNLYENYCLDHLYEYIDKNIECFFKIVYNNSNIRCSFIDNGFLCQKNNKTMYNFGKIYTCKIHFTFITEIIKTIHKNKCYINRNNEILTEILLLKNQFNKIENKINYMTNEVNLYKKRNKKRKLSEFID